MQIGLNRESQAYAPPLLLLRLSVLLPCLSELPIINVVTPMCQAWDRFCLGMGCRGSNVSCFKGLGMCNRDGL